MEKYCSSCGKVFKDSDFKICPYCGNQLKSRVGRQPIPRKLRHQVFQRDNYRCRECGATKEQTRLHVDHIKPVSKGGTNDINNLQTLCEDCNLAKYTDEWIGGKLEKTPKSSSLRKSHSRLTEENNGYATLFKNRLEQEKRDRLFNSITDDQIKIFNNYSYYNRSKTEIIDELCKNYSEEEIYRKFEILEKEKEKNEELFNRLYDNLTDEQLGLLYSKFHCGKRSKEEYLRYICYNYSENRIYQVISQSEIEKAEKEKLIKKLHDDLTDNQLKILYWKFPQYKGLKNELIVYLCDKYSKNQIYSLLDQLQEEYDNRIDEDILKQNLTPERMELLSLLDPSYKNENYQKLVDKLLWIYNGSQIHQILEGLDNINNQLAEFNKQKDMNGFCILGFIDIWYYYYLTPNGEYERFYSFSKEDLKPKALSKDLPWYNEEFKCNIVSGDYLVNKFLREICSKIDVTTPTPHEEHYSFKSINITSEKLHNIVMSHLSFLSKFEPPKDIFKPVIHRKTLPDNIICPNCGKTIPEKALRCKYCKKMMGELVVMVNNELELFGLNPDEFIVVGYKN